MMSLSTNNSLSAAAQTANKKINAPAGIKTTADAANEALAAKESSGMGQKDFLTLFTTQLKCQDPLDPVKNEAFVAQLAQSIGFCINFLWNFWFHIKSYKNKPIIINR